MKIGILGAGRIGGTLTRCFRALGHEVSVANSRDPETLADLAVETGATAKWAADVPMGPRWSWSPSPKKASRTFPRAS